MSADDAVYLLVFESFEYQMVRIAKRFGQSFIELRQLPFDCITRIGISIQSSHQRAQRKPYERIGIHIASSELKFIAMADEVCLLNSGDEKIFRKLRKSQPTAYGLSIFFVIADDILQLGLVFSAQILYLSECCFMFWFPRTEELDVSSINHIAVEDQSFAWVFPEKRQKLLRLAIRRS